MWRSISSLAIAVWLAYIPAETFGQSARAPQAFEVASIRANPGPWHVLMGYSSSGTRLTLEAFDVAGLITEAYNVKGDAIAFTPSSIEYYDIVAKAAGEGSLTRVEFRPMLQTLLAERFNLKFHREMREMPVYALVLGKNGPKFKESAPDAPRMSNHGVNGRNQNMTLSQVTMESVADQIKSGSGLDRPVLDRTGLAGKYDIKLEATPEFRINSSPQPGDISVFDAVQQQLGLKLEPQKAIVDVLVVDHVEKPTAN